MIIPSLVGKKDRITDACIYSFVYIHIYIYISVYVCICVYVCVCLCMCVCMLLYLDLSSIKEVKRNETRGDKG